MAVNYILTAEKYFLSDIADDVFLPVAPQMSLQLSKLNTFFTEYLMEKRKDTNFETLPDTLLAEVLRVFFAEVRKQDGKPYSKSGMVNLRAGLNRYLQAPPNNRIINLMHNDAFQNANRVFCGVLRDNKENGLDKSKPKTSIAPGDLEKLYNEYFLPGLADGDVEILQQKVFFDLVYYTSRRGKEGLRQLKKEYFVFKETPEGLEYIELIVNEVTKKNQGDQCSTRLNNVHNDEKVIFAQPGSDRCPVNSFKHYLKLLNDKIPWLFQRPNVAKKRYDAMVVGKHPLGNMMATISERAHLSRRYTNHNIRRTGGNAMKKGGATAQTIAHQLQQKNIQSMMHYLDLPTLEEKQENQQLLFKYTHDKDAPAAPGPKPKSVSEPQPQLAIEPVVQNNENVSPENALVPFEPNFDDKTPPSMPLANITPNIGQSNNQVVTNQVRQAPVMFQGATFQNCTITLNVPQ